MNIAPPTKVEPRKQTELEIWTDRFRLADGGRGRRKVARAYKRHNDKKVVVANRRRFRQWNEGRMTASTVGQQLRILGGEFGTDAQRARIFLQYSKIAQEQGLHFDSVIADMRVQLGLDELVSAE